MNMDFSKPLANLSHDEIDGLLAEVDSTLKLLELVQGVIDNKNPQGDPEALDRDLAQIAELKAAHDSAEGGAA